MLRKHIITTLLFLLCALAGAQAQQLTVSSFKGLPTDLDARVNYPVIDQNGKKCAIIKVENSNTGFTFDTGTLSVQKVEQKVAEIWVYVQPGVRKITIKHQTLGILREYIFPEQIKEATVYAMKLESGNVHTVVEQMPVGAYLTMRLTPANAMVWIDDKLQETNDGVMVAFLNNGSHAYRVQAAGFAQEIGKVEINGERKDMQVALNSTKAILKLSCADPQTALFVDGKQVGKGQWSGELIPGTHILEVKRDGHRPQTKSVELNECETFEHSFDEPVPILGSLQVESLPIDAEVWLDGENIGTTPYGPMWHVVGTHQLEFRKPGYETQKRSVVINEGKTTWVKNTLKKDDASTTTFSNGNEQVESSPFRSRGFEVNVGLSVLCTTYTHDCGTLYGKYFDVTYCALVGLGYRFSPYFYLGVGSGLLYGLIESGGYMPIYIDGRVDFSKKKNAPYVNLKYGVGSFTDEYEYLDDKDAPFYYAIAVGYSFGKFDFALQYMVQKRWQSCDINYDDWGVVTCDGCLEKLNMFGLTLSYNF